MSSFPQWLNLQLWLQAYDLRNAGAVLHSHSINAVMATMLQESNEGIGCVGEFRVTNLEMIKVVPFPMPTTIPIHPDEFSLHLPKGDSAASSPTWTTMVSLSHDYSTKRLLHVLLYSKHEFPQISCTQ